MPRVERAFAETHVGGISFSGWEIRVAARLQAGCISSPYNVPGLDSYPRSDKPTPFAFIR